MTRTAKPSARPANPRFSSGPCAKRPGWTPQALSGALIGRSHRSREGKAKLADVIARTREILQLPEGYQAAIVPASDTGAFEMAMWNMLGARGTDVFAWEIFGRIWLKDALDILTLGDLRVFDADWGQLPDLSQADPARDVIFTWNGTTTGVRVKDASWISDKREGLTFCDATSAVFAQRIDFSKIDVLTYSWQKVLGGEAAHGMIILSPRAFERLESYTPAWPIPKIMRLKDKGKILRDVFDGITINTPSMLC
ncbi:MAG: phosphoserine transaminase, partial [Hyphomicrobiaceae bacterium]|nr:phosphoserine transaminase [Hyphomicrobiaceae bacterium]